MTGQESECARGEDAVCAHTTGPCLKDAASTGGSTRCCSPGPVWKEIVVDTRPGWSGCRARSDVSVVGAQRYDTVSGRFYTELAGNRKRQEGEGCEWLQDIRVSCRKNGQKANRETQKDRKSAAAAQVFRRRIRRTRQRYWRRGRSAAAWLDRPTERRKKCKQSRTKTRCAPSKVQSVTRLSWGTRER